MMTERSLLSCVKENIRLQILQLQLEAKERKNEHMRRMVKLRACTDEIHKTATNVIKLEASISQMSNDVLSKLIKENVSAPNSMVLLPEAHSPFVEIFKRCLEFPKYILPGVNIIKPSVDVHNCEKLLRNVWTVWTEICDTKARHVKLIQKYDTKVSILIQRANKKGKNKKDELNTTDDLGVRPLVDVILTTESYENISGNMRITSTPTANDFKSRLPGVTISPFE